MLLNLDDLVAGEYERNDEERRAQGLQVGFVVVVVAHKLVPGMEAYNLRYTLFSFIRKMTVTLGRAYCNYCRVGKLMAIMYVPRLGAILA